MIKDNFMKKFILTTLLFLISSNLIACSFVENKKIKTESKPYEEKFVNPLFYKRLNPKGKASAPTYLSPKYLLWLFDIYNNKEEWKIEYCDLKENTFEYIKLKCFYYFLSNEMHFWHHKYELGPCTKTDNNGECIRRDIRRTEYDDENFTISIGTSPYSIELN